MGERRQPSAAFHQPRLGRELAGEVIKHNIASLSNDIVAGKVGVSIANAPLMRRAASGRVARSQAVYAARSAPDSGDFGL
ncbi:hypothetical protein AS156_15355 [Bradyrhizobium macuxiense]|uniref:Uncharacterized protein n=1 Tax=Bradyrhizobium macuxiense TaxID=1755647 RepID=A0A109JIZ8_9BRAD|nr:hypothetical protein [Bradyrhizobium macuxiense]KWV49898.1 hypothetical protein AS156_15355 [Bradyrhizobium macuxiense]